MKQTTKDIEFNNYKIWILDFDGTLYYQLPVRVIMGCWLMFYYLLHPFRLKEFFFLLEYRKLKENLTDIVLSNNQQNELLINRLCEKYHVVSNDMIATIKMWFETKPRFFIFKFQRRKFINTIREYQKKGVLMVIYSDNPLQEKLEAISFTPDYYFDSNHAIINCMKPNTQGLNNIIKILKKEPEEFLYIGDRYDRDGTCAKNAGISYFDVNDFLKLVNDLEKDYF